MILTLFYVFAFAMMALLGIVLLKSVLNPAIRDETNHRDVNIGIARDRKTLIKDALSKGHIDKDTYAQELDDIEKTLAAELTEGPDNSHSRIMRGVGVFMILGTLVAVSVLLYQRLGTTIAMQNQYLAQTGSVIMANGATVNERIAPALESGADPRAAVAQANAAASADADKQAASIAELLPQLEARLEQDPTDVQGWLLLARTYMNVGEFKKAEDALLRVNEIDDSNPELVIMLAEAGALQNQGDLTGEPQQLIRKALELDPTNQRGLLLLALSHQQSAEHEQAIEILETLRANPNLSAEGAANIQQMIGQSLAAMNVPEHEAANAPIIDANNGSTNSGSATDSSANSSADSATDASANSDSAAGPSLSVSVELSEQAKAAAGDDDSVFIFAVASNGPPMPLAAIRLSVTDLPTTVVLDSSQAMIPNMTLSTFPSVTVGARVSSSGDAIAKTGDWFGEQTDVSTTDDSADAIEIVIDQQTP